MKLIAENLEKVRSRIESAAKAAGRNPADVTLIAVTKTRTADEINEAIRAGVTDIGENKPQEIRDKYADVIPGVRWHMIGHLQTNKIKYIIDKVCMIHSVDSLHLMEEIDKQAKKHSLVMDILIEVNISGEETKHGIKPEELPELLTAAANLPNIHVCGLMTVAPKNDKDFTNSLHFDNIYKLFVDINRQKYDNIDMRCLSMGMSGDFEAAVKSGSTMVRIGSAIFGERDYSKIL